MRKQLITRINDNQQINQSIARVTIKHVKKAQSLLFAVGNVAHNDKEASKKAEILEQLNCELELIVT